MKTSEEFLKNFNEEENNIDKLYYDSYVKKAMIEFAKLHIEEALKEAEIVAQKTWGNSKIMKESVLNAYPLENIK